MTLEEMKWVTEEMEHVAPGNGQRIMCDSSCGCPACIVENQFFDMARTALPKLIKIARQAFLLEQQLNGRNMDIVEPLKEALAALESTDGP